MTLARQLRPYEMTEVVHLKITATGANRQLAKAPYASPAGGRLRIVKAYVYNAHATNPSVINIWDQDLDNGAVPTVGAVATPLFVIVVPALSVVALTEEQIPARWYNSGIACQITNNDNYIFLELAKDIG